ncbi:hypothetical protein EF919_03375 [Streptomyces sp. WAC02707]|uniref:hypothetical protein n=1 Tax=Streptomyces sp. WAC02707 TaxID=2487417 RepID=UPI000F782D14|nr:hypothetical protein [Streptomyces sp. WAC02707]RSS97501.1 hypothetical protein EF919_03375 [Streptomyces sp. WAC02707]
MEYAEEHPDETVFFVSANTKDFGDGTSYPYPMNKDIADAGVADRFILMTSLDEVASHFTEPAEVDEGLSPRSWALRQFYRIWLRPPK